MLTILDLIFVASYVISFLQFAVDGRRQMMMMRCIGFSLMAFYMIGHDSMVGLAACGIAVFGSALQVICPDRFLRQTRFLRLGVALTLVMAAVDLYAGSPMESLALLSVAVARFAEIQSSAQSIRMTLMLSQLFWLAYAFDQGFIMMVGAEYLGIMLNLQAIWRYERRRQRVPVFVTPDPFRVVA